jgi:hypothetical protein
MLHASVADVLHVMVDGEFVKKDGRLTASDYKETRKSFLNSAAKIQKTWRELEYPELEGEFNNGGFYYASPRIVSLETGLERK